MAIDPHAHERILRAEMRELSSKIATHRGTIARTQRYLDRAETRRAEIERDLNEIAARRG